MMIQASLFDDGGPAREHDPEPRGRRPLPPSRCVRCHYSPPMTPGGLCSYCHGHDLATKREMEELAARALDHVAPRFDGETIGESDGEAGDTERLKSLLDRVRELMLDGQWRTLATIQAQCGGTEASISARLRDFRKARFGGHTVERRSPGRGLFEYRLILNP